MSLPTCFACTYSLRLSVLCLNEFVSSCSRRGYWNSCAEHLSKTEGSKNTMKKASRLLSMTLAAMVLVSVLADSPASAA